MIKRIIKYLQRQQAFREIRQHSHQPPKDLGPLHLSPRDRVIYRSMKETNAPDRRLSTAERDIMRLSTKERKALKMLKEPEPFYKHPAFAPSIAGLIALTGALALYFTF